MSPSPMQCPSNYALGSLDQRNGNMLSFVLNCEPRVPPGSNLYFEDTVQLKVSKNMMVHAKTASFKN